MGVTAHWIEVKDGAWTLRAGAIACKAVAGSHTGRNLARYFWGSCQRVGIFSSTKSKVRCYFISVVMLSLIALSQLNGLTLDNTSSNDTLARVIEIFIGRRTHSTWNAKANRIP